MTDNGKMKSSATTMDVFGTVNRLRKDRANAIEDFETYRRLFFCLNHYGPNRLRLQQQVSKKMIRKLERDGETGERNRSLSRFGTSANDEGEIEYVLSEGYCEQDNEFFSGYYDIRVPRAATYLNIEEMSEYI